MVLAVHSDASHLNELEARSRAGRNFSLSSNVAIPTNNDAILSVGQVIEKCDVFGSRGQTWSNLYNGARGNIHSDHTQRNESQKNCHTDPNGQFHSQRNHQQLHPTQINQGNGHAILLATWLQDSGEIPILLASRKTEPCRLLDETPSGNASQKRAKRTFDTKESLERITPTNDEGR